MWTIIVQVHSNGIHFYSQLFSDKAFERKFAKTLCTRLNSLQTYLPQFD